MPGPLRYQLVIALTCGVLVSGCISVPALAQTQSQAQFTAKELVEIVRPRGASIRLAPNGERLAYVHPDMSDETNLRSRRPTGYIHIREVSRTNEAHDGKAVAILGKGNVHTSFPVWSPNGKRLAYFVREDGQSRLAVWNAETGERRKLGAPFAGRPYLAPQWDSNGERIIFARAVKQPELADSLFLPPPTFMRAVRGHTAEDVARVVVVDSEDKRIPGDSVFIDHKRASLAVVEVSSGEETRLTEEPVHLRDFRVSPASSHAIYTVPTQESFGRVGREVLATTLVSLDGSEAPRRMSDDGKTLRWMPRANGLYYIKNGTVHTIGLSDKEPGALSGSQDLQVQSAEWAPNGRRLAALVVDESMSDPEIEPPQENMYSIAQPFLDLHLISPERSETRNLTENLDDQIRDPVWSPDGDSIFFRSIDNETYDETLYRYDIENNSLIELAGGEESFDNLTYGGGRVLFTAESATHPPDIFSIDIKSGKRHRVVALNPQLSKFNFSNPERFYFHNGDGEKLGALLYRPAGVDSSTPVPVITYVYEKLTPRIHEFSPTHQIFLNHGFAVLMPNVKVEVGETGSSFVKSVVPATAKVREMGFTNGKFAIWGGSFGAYATAYIITQTDLFDCAASRATPPDLFGNWASGRDRDSRNIERGQARMGGNPYEVMKRYLAQSAFFHLDKVETPILIMHGAQDKTILFDEGETLFYALRQLGKEAKFVAYTHGDHSLYRHSHADAIDVHKRLLNWFNGCLK